MCCWYWCWIFIWMGKKTAPISTDELLVAWLWAKHVLYTVLIRASVLATKNHMCDRFGVCVFFVFFYFRFLAVSFFLPLQNNNHESHYHAYLEKCWYLHLRNENERRTPDNNTVNQMLMRMTMLFFRYRTISRYLLLFMIVDSQQWFSCHRSAFYLFVVVYLFVFLLSVLFMCRPIYIHMAIYVSISISRWFHSLDNIWLMSVLSLTCANPRA